MAASSYDQALARLLQHEGGYTNHPSDPGGPTNFGITIYDYRHYLKPDATAADIKAMTLSEAKSIYRPKYWDAMRCDALEPGVDYAVFDYGVNSGVGRAGRVLRRVLDLPDTASAITPDVVTVANRMYAADLVRAICDERLHFLQSLKTWPVFGHGWGPRVAAVKAYGISIASDLPIVDTIPLVPAPGRGIDPDKFAKVRALQQHLTDIGFDPGAIDGDLGPKTVKAFQESRGMSMIDGIVGSKTKPLLDKAIAEIVPLPAMA